MTRHDGGGGLGAELRQSGKQLNNKKQKVAGQKIPVHSESKPKGEDGLGERL